MDGWMGVDVDGWNGWMGVEWGGSFGRGSFDVTALSSTVDSATETSPRARFRNSRTPAGFTPKGWPSGLRTRGRFSTFEPAKSKERWMDGWMDGWGVEALAVALSSTVDSAAETPPRARLRNSRTPAGFRPKGWPIGLRTRGRFSTFEPAKSKERWMDGWMDGGGMGWKLWPWAWQHRGCGRRNTSTPRLRNSRTPAGFRPKVRTMGAVSAPSNQLSSKRDGWMDGWMGVEWGGSFGRGPEQHRGFGCRNTS